MPLVYTVEEDPNPLKHISMTCITRIRILEAFLPYSILLLNKLVLALLGKNVHSPNHVLLSSTSHHMNY